MVIVHAAGTSQGVQAGMHNSLNRLHSHRGAYMCLDLMNALVCIIVIIMHDKDLTLRCHMFATGFKGGFESQ